MESPEADIKPIIPIDDIPDKSLLTVCKLKQSRYEDVWPEDVHAAFMEAVALYPPMGKRRLKYYRVPTHENEHYSDANRAKSFGRCQLIQSYILEKTGKNRSRKQVSSHLQRLKKIHKDNPSMRPFFSERSQPPIEHCSPPQAAGIPSQDIFANISFSTRHLKSDFDLTINLQNTDTSNDSSPIFPYVSEPSSSNASGSSCNAPDLSTNFHNQRSAVPSPQFLSPQQCPAVLRPSDSDYLYEFQDPLLCRDTINGGIRPGNTSAFSISMRRLASRLPIQGRADSPTTHFPRMLHASAFQQTHQWISHDVLADGICSNPPLTPIPQLFHTQFHSHQVLPSEKLDTSLASDWRFPQNSDMVLGFREGSFDDYPSMMYHNPTSPETRGNSPIFYGSSSESEILRLPQGLSYSYMSMSPATVSESFSAKSVTDFPGQESCEHLASSSVVRPTPVYPVSYIHSDDARTSPPSSNLLPPSTTI